MSNFSSHYLTGDWIWEWLEDGRIYLAFRSIWHWGGKKQDSKSFLRCQSSFSHLGKSGLRMFTLLDTWIVVKLSTRANLSGNLLKFQVSDFIYKAYLNKIKSNSSFWSNQCKKSKIERETDREKESNNSHKSDKFCQAQIKFPAFFSLPLEGWLVSHLWAAIGHVLKAPKTITFYNPGPLTVMWRQFCAGAIRVISVSAVLCLSFSDATFRCTGDDTQSLWCSWWVHEDNIL